LSQREREREKERERDRERGETEREERESMCAFCIESAVFPTHVPQCRDKRTRVDDVFGSTGGAKLPEVMAEYDALHPRDDGAAGGQDGDNDDENDENDDDAGTGDMIAYSKDNSTRPNRFVCLRIDGPEVVQNVMQVHSRIISYDHQLHPALQSTQSLHITLVTLLLTDQAETSAAEQVLRDFQDKLPHYFPRDRKIALTGAGKRAREPEKERERERERGRGRGRGRGREIERERG
jgi:hypothetical protein